MQKQVSAARSATEEHLKALQEAQAATAVETKALSEKATALTAELEAAKVSHEPFPLPRVTADCTTGRCDVPVHRVVPPQHRLTLACPSRSLHETCHGLNLCSALKAGGCRSKTEADTQQLAEGSGRSDHGVCDSATVSCSDPFLSLNAGGPCRGGGSPEG